MTAQPPPGWTVRGGRLRRDPAGGAAGTSAATAAGATANLVLAGGETVTCSYTVAPPARRG